MIVPIDIQSPPEDLDALLQIALPELEALDPQQHVRRSVSRPRVLELSNTLLVSWAELIEQLDAQLSAERAEQRRVELQRLDGRAWVFYKADLDSEEFGSNLVLEERRKLGRAVTAHDRLLSKWAVPLLGDDPDNAEILRDISRGIGARDDAEDVLRLVALFRSNWEAVSAKQQVVTQAVLDQAAADATRQIDVLRNGMTNPARRLADAAYTLWYRDYQELMLLGRYLTRYAPDSVERFPGVRELPTRSSADEDVEDVEDGEDGEDGGDGGDDSPQAVEDPNAAA